MKEHTYKIQQRKARMEDSLFAEGYRRGLRRHYFGERFGSAEEHAGWMKLGRDGDYRTELGNGYRSGFAGELFKPDSE